MTESKGKGLVSFTLAEMKESLARLELEYHTTPHTPNGLDGQGWDIFDTCGERGLEIERCDDERVFQFDDDAITHVILGASVGNRKMILALCIHALQKEVIAREQWEAKQAAGVPG